MARAIDKARAFARQAANDMAADMTGADGEESGMDIAIPQDKRLEIQAALDGIPGERTASIDFGELDGFSPDLPEAVSFSDIEGEDVFVVQVTKVDNIFANDRPDASPWAWEFVFQRSDQRFYRGVSSNGMVLRQGELIGRMLLRFAGVSASIIGVDVRGQSNKAYGFGPARNPFR